MNAKEFVKKYGWAESKRIVSVCPIDMNYRHLNVCHVLVADLKTLVDAYELVRKHGDLKMAKHYLNNGYCLSADHTWDELKQAIKLVESVDEN